jgi:hypothetical protein
MSELTDNPTEQFRALDEHFAQQILVLEIEIKKNSKLCDELNKEIQNLKDSYENRK